MAYDEPVRRSDEVPAIRDEPNAPRARAGLLCESAQQRVAIGAADHDLPVILQ